LLNIIFFHQQLQVEQYGQNGECHYQRDDKPLLVRERNAAILLNSHGNNDDNGRYDTHSCEETHHTITVFQTLEPD